MTLSTRSEDPSTPDFSFNHQKTTLIAHRSVLWLL